MQGDFKMCEHSGAPEAFVAQLHHHGATQRLIVKLPISAALGEKTSMPTGQELQAKQGALHNLCMVAWGAAPHAQKCNKI